jgi:hypothetical protein
MDGIDDLVAPSDRPATAESIQQLRAQIDEGKSIFDKKRWWYRAGTLFLMLLAAALSGATTIILGLNFDQLSPAFVKNSALILSSAVTFIATIQAFYDPRRMWITFNDTLNSFYAIEAAFKYDSARYGKAISQHTIDMHYRNTQAAFAAVNQIWTAARNVVESKPAQSPSKGAA